MARDWNFVRRKEHAGMPARWETELIGLLAGFCTTLSLVPQLHRMWRSKSAHDLSLAMFFVFGLGVVLWLLYGIGIRSPAVITTNSVSLVLVIVIYTLALHYEHARSARR
ncbi:MAG: SemiSWEET transporter [Terracidiphilus sp.]